MLNIKDADVGLTGVYMGRRRMTLTYPVINRSRRILWLMTGSEKLEMLAAFARTATRPSPQERISRDQAVILADRAAAGNLQSK